MRSSVVACWSACVLILGGAGCGSLQAMPEGLLEALGADAFAERERAAAELGEWAAGNGQAAIDEFFIQSVENADPEIRMRCRELLRDVVLVEFRQHGEGYVGIQMGQFDVRLADGESFGVEVKQVMDDTPAEAAGLRVNDVITAIDGRAWKQAGAMKAFQAEVMERRPGEVVRLQVQRPGEAERFECEVKLARRPPIREPMLLWQGQEPVDPRKLQREEEDQHFEKWYERRLREYRGRER